MERRSSSGTDGPKTHTLVVTIGADQNEKTVGELCNTLALFGGSAVETLVNGIDGPIIDELNATLATVGLVGTVTLIVTFRKPGITPIPARVDSSTLNVDTNVHQSIFRSVEVPFDRTPFGLELEGDEGTVFVRQIDPVNPAGEKVKPQDVITDVNGVSVRGKRLSEVLRIIVAEKECLATGKPVLLKFQRLALHNDADIKGNRAVCKPGFVAAAARFVGSVNFRTMLLYTAGPLGLKLRDDARDNKDAVGVSVFEVKDGCIAKDASIEAGDKLAFVNGNDTSSMPYSTASRIMTAFLRQMSPAQPLVLGFVRMSGPPPTTVASLLVRKPTGATADPDKHSVTTQGQPAQRSKTKSSKRSVASVDDDRSKKGEKSITVATSAVVPLTEMSPGDPIPEEAVFPTEADAAAKKSEEAPVKPAFKPSSRNWVTGLVNRPNAGGLRAKSPTTDPNIRRYNYTPESEDYVTREATQTTNAMSRRQARQPTKAPSIMSASESRADVRSLSAGRALQMGPIEGFRTKTGAIISKAYEDSRRRAASRSQSNGPVHERSRTPVYERLYRKSVPPSPVPPLYARPQSSLSTGSKPRSRSVPHKEYSTRMIAPIARQPQAARDVLLAERSSSRASASTGFDSHSMWNRLYDTENGIPADIEAAKAKHSQLQRSARYVAEQRIRSFSEKRPSKAAHRVPTQPEDMPSYARPLKRHLMIGTTTGEVREVDDVVMTPHAINKTFFSGLRDGSTGTPRAKRFDWPEAPLIDCELKPIGEEPERARKGRQPAKGGNNAGEQDELLGVDSEPAVLGSGPRNMGPGRMSVKALAEAKQQREGRSSSRGVSQQQQRQTPNSTNDRSVSRSKSRPRERSGSAIRSRYSQEAIASERKAIKKAKQARQQQDRIGSGGLMKNITSDIIRELQQEHDWLIRQAAKLGLKKVGTRRVSTAPTPLTPKSNSGPSATAPKPAMYSRRLSTASDDNPISASLYVSAESNGFGSSWDAPPSPRRQAAMQHQQQQQAQQQHGKREQKRGKSPAIEQKRGKSPAMDSVASLRTTPFEGLDEWSDELFKVGMMAATGDNLSELSGGTSPGNPSALPYSL